MDPTATPTPATCTICSAMVESSLLPQHLDWHERLVDDVVTSVKVRLADPPRDG